jgi:SAM-dependent methyltransferase
MSGTGTGEFGVDGSPVEAYAAMSDDTYAAGLVHAAVPPGATVLELGCGTGRVTRPLLELGHPVVAVDGSPAMLAHVHGARTVCADIEGLDLDERFDVVLLMSYLVECGRREALLSACGRHVADGGSVILQRLPPRIFETLDTLDQQVDGAHHRVRTSRPGPGLLTITVEHRLGDQVWTHTGTCRQLSDEELPQVLAAAGLRFDRFLSTEGWILAGVARG